MIENRREERVSAALPVLLGASTGTTRDVSASGVFFETSASFAVGESLTFTVEFDGPGGKMLLSCRGNIVRTQQSGDRIGVAVVLTESAMTMAEDATARNKSALA